MFIDTYKPESPVLAYQYHAGAKIYDFLLYNNQIVLALGEAGVQILQLKMGAEYWVDQLQLLAFRPGFDQIIYDLYLEVSDSFGQQHAIISSFLLNYQPPPRSKKFTS